MNIYEKIDKAIDEYYAALQNLYDVFAEADGYKSKIRVFGEIGIVTTSAMNQLVVKAWGGKPNTRHKAR